MEFDDVVESVRKELKLVCEPILMTGSRVFGDHTEKSDWDLVILVSPPTKKELEITTLAAHFAPCGNIYEGDNHLIVRREKDNINLIITDDESTFHKWQVCTLFATKMELNKKQRAKVFSAIINDHLYQEVLTPPPPEQRCGMHEGILNE
jgi:predicted nucleotidyltransferase